MIDDWFREHEALVWWSQVNGVGLAIAAEDEKGGCFVSWGNTLEDAIREVLMGQTERFTLEEVKRCGFLSVLNAAILRARARTVSP